MLEERKVALTDQLRTSAGKKRRFHRLVSLSFRFAMPPAKSKRTQIDMGQMSEEEENDGPSVAKKRMLEQNLVKLAEDQTSPKRTVTGSISVQRQLHEDDGGDDISDPPIVPLIAVVETVSLVVPESQSQRSLKACDQVTASSVTRPNFKAFVKKGNRRLMGSQTSASQVSLVEHKLESYDRREYQVITALLVLRLMSSLSSHFFLFRLSDYGSRS